MAKQRMTLQELLGVYQQFSPEANARQELLQAEVDSAPLRLRQMEQQLRSNELSNNRVEQLTPLEVEAADAANRLAARLADPQVKAAELETVYRGLQNRLAELEGDFGEATLDERVRRVGLDNTLARERGTLDLNRFNADRTDAAFEREMANKTLERDAIRGEQELNLRLAGALSAPGDQEGVDNSRSLLEAQFPQIPLGLPAEVKSQLKIWEQVPFTADSLKIYGPQIAALVESNPKAENRLPRKARLLYDFYKEGMRKGSDLTTDQRQLFN